MSVSRRHISTLLWKNVRASISRPWILLCLLLPILAMIVHSLWYKLNRDVLFFREKDHSFFPHFSFNELAVVSDPMLLPRLQLRFPENRTSFFANVSAWRSHEGRPSVALVVSSDNATSNSYFSYQLLLTGENFPLLSLISVFRLPNPPELVELSQNYQLSTFLVPLGFMFLAAHMCYTLVEEKANGTREMLKIAGVSETSWALSWALFYWIPALVLAPVLSFCFDVFPSGSAFPIFLMIALFPLSLFAFSYMFSAFFDQSLSASNVFFLSIPVFSLCLATPYLVFRRWLQFSSRRSVCIVQ